MIKMRLWSVFGLMVAMAMSTPNVSADERNNVNPKPVVLAATKSLREMQEQSWFWNPGASPKSAREVVDLITTANRRNSNFPLNVGPDRQGRFEESSVRVLAEIGKLLKANNGPQKRV